MPGNFKLSHVSYFNAVSDLEVYSKFNGDVHVEKGLFVPNSPTRLHTKIWDVVCSIFSAAKRAENVRKTKEKADQIAESLKTIKKTHNALKNPKPYEEKQSFELELCTIAFNILSKSMEDWNRIALTPPPELSRFNRFIQLIKNWLGYKIVPLDVIALGKMKVEARDLVFCEKVRKIREARFGEFTELFMEFQNEVKKKIGKKGDKIQIRAPYYIVALNVFGSLRPKCVEIDPSLIHPVFSLAHFDKEYRTEQFNRTLQLANIAYQYTFSNEISVLCARYLVQDLYSLAEAERYSEVKQAIEKVLAIYQNPQDSRYGTVRTQILELLTEKYINTAIKNEVLAFAKEQLKHAQLTEAQIDHAFDQDKQVKLFLLLTTYLTPGKPFDKAQPVITRVLEKDGNYSKIRRQIHELLKRYIVNHPNPGKVIEFAMAHLDHPQLTAAKIVRELSESRPLPEPSYESEPHLEPSTARAPVREAEEGRNA